MIPKLEDPEPHYKFPDPDLLTSLVDLYFANMNSFLPLLHRPIFEKSLTDDLHLRDDGFGAVVLLVAAVGARFSDDLRVALPGTDAMHSAGWAWFNQVQMVRRSLFSPPSLYDLQIYCVRYHNALLGFLRLTVYRIAVRALLAGFFGSTVVLDYYRYRYSTGAGRRCSQTEGLREQPNYRG